MSISGAIRIALALAVVQTAPALAQGAPSAADTLENNLNALRPPSVGAPPSTRVPTPQQSLDANIDSLRGTRRNAPTPVYPPSPVPPIQQPVHVTRTRRAPYLEVIPSGSPHGQPRRNVRKHPRH